MSAAMTAAAMTAAAMSAATATVAATSAAMTANVRPSYFTFFVEDVEGRQADIGNFFITESDLIAISIAWSE
jgi:hypothetical protein